MYPVNSAQDDFGIVFQGRRERGLFTSGRDKGRGGDDIYSFVLPELEFKVEGTIIDKSSGKPIAEANVKLIGSDGTIIDSKTRLDFDFGMVYKWKNLSVGISTTHLTQSNSKATNYKVSRHNYFYAKYNYQINQDFTINPSISLNNHKNILNYLTRLSTFIDPKYMAKVIRLYKERPKSIQFKITLFILRLLSLLNSSVKIAVTIIDSPVVPKRYSGIRRLLR